MFGRATIRLGIGPHSSYSYYLSREEGRVDFNFNEQVAATASGQSCCAGIFEIATTRARRAQLVLRPALYAGEAAVALFIVFTVFSAASVKSSRRAWQAGVVALFLLSAVRRTRLPTDHSS